ncbi:GntR family transcriptional regulator [Actinomadura sp. WMMB 499]|uniref:GntR family transcriptional regulator n=1 Tax=Actinomadura sp. WMMB 499 TaxID=1219491 RepID=UPI00159DA0DD|nr:GntR family transcriptional regulator [Actinomadura sp. WMMB 499]
MTLEVGTIASTGTGTRVARLVEQIRRDIAATRFAPGQRVTESGLAELYGTSRTPVREALRILTREMLLDHVPNWGYRVSQLDLTDLDDLYAVRLAIETQAVSRLASGECDLDPVRLLLVRWDVDRSRMRVDVSLVFEDERFHESLALASGGTVLHSMLQVVNGRLHSARMREFIDERRVLRTYDQHTEILRAILGGDPPVAAALMTAHVLEGKQFVRKIVAADRPAPADPAPPGGADHADREARAR